MCNLRGQQRGMPSGQSMLQRTEVNNIEKSNNSHDALGGDLNTTPAFGP